MTQETIQQPRRGSPRKTQRKVRLNVTIAPALIDAARQAAKGTHETLSEFISRAMDAELRKSQTRHS